MNPNLTAAALLDEAVLALEEGEAERALDLATEGSRLAEIGRAHV